MTPPLEQGTKQPRFSLSWPSCCNNWIVSYVADPDPWVNSYIYIYMYIIVYIYIYIQTRTHTHLGGSLRVFFFVDRFPNPQSSFIRRKHRLNVIFSWSAYDVTRLCKLQDIGWSFPLYHGIPGYPKKIIADLSFFNIVHGICMDLGHIINPPAIEVHIAIYISQGVKDAISVKIGWSNFWACRSASKTDTQFI